MIINELRPYLERTILLIINSNVFYGLVFPGGKTTLVSRVNIGF